ncbi:aminotransferase class I/II-fold pyridoxal phosphate-dependent enzyme [Pseudofulvimonas gallinarii]|uniref:aminotransferase class I/II-fold pyridoxal phosphate-dependent enzyme n=1 Tax=Pseudofulvimonas gallinarii TaxID=634155 RepID=UPI0035E4EFD7
MEALQAIPGIVCPRPQGAFYVFPDISVAFGKRHGRNADRQRRRFLRRAAGGQGRRLRAGSAFGEPRALRISYTCPTAQLAEGLKRIQAFFAELA